MHFILSEISHQTSLLLDSHHPVCLHFPMKYCVSIVKSYASGINSSLKIRHGFLRGKSTIHIFHQKLFSRAMNTKNTVLNKINCNNR